MTDQSSIIQRFQQLPRSLHWLTYAVGFTLLFLAWNDTLMPVKTKWDAKADAIERDVQEVRATGQMADKLKRMEDTIIGLGNVAMPGSDGQGRTALTNAVNEVIKDASISSYDFTLSAGGKLPREVYQNLVTGTAKLSSLTGELKFDASPAEAIEIISALEKRDDIESISKARITKASAGKVTVRVTLESWVISEEKKRGRL